MLLIYFDALVWLIVRQCPHHFSQVSHLPPVNPSLYRQLVGSLLYLTHTRPDIAFAVGLVSRFSQDPHESHWKAAKHILRYIKGTVRFGIQYTVGTLELVDFTDFD